MGRIEKYDYYVFIEIVWRILTAEKFIKSSI